MGLTRGAFFFLNLPAVNSTRWERPRLAQCVTNAGSYGLPKSIITRAWHAPSQRDGCGTPPDGVEPKHLHTRGPSRAMEPVANFGAEGPDESWGVRGFEASRAEPWIASLPQDRNLSIDNSSTSYFTCTAKLFPRISIFCLTYEGEKGIISNCAAALAQLDRAFDYESKGHRFESYMPHH